MLDSLLKGGSVLVLGAHPDDELGCGATIAKLIKNGVPVYHYYFSKCQQSLDSLGLPVEQLMEECNNSRMCLGIDLDKCGNFDYPVRYLPANRQDILEDLLILKKEINPTLVLVPNGHDIHQDHHCLYEEAVRAFKFSSILGFELPWNTLTMKHDCLIRVDENHLKAKMEALKCYKSQMNRSYANIEFFESLAKVRGVQANTTYAECFEVVRLYF